MDNIPEIQLLSGNSSLTIGQATGKISSLKCANQNLLIEPLIHEWIAALSETNRTKFESLDAWGGDECFPTIGGSDLWRLRDHGNIWGKTPTINFATDGRCTTGWQWPKGHFKRNIEAIKKPIHSDCLGAYHIRLNFSPSFFSIDEDIALKTELHIKSIYAAHTLFSAQPGDRIEWGNIAGQTDLESLLNGPYERDISKTKHFAPDDIPVASKFYLHCPNEFLFVTSLVRKQLAIRIDVIQNTSLPYVGIWWCHNGWGDGRPHSTVGIEPTNLPSDGPILSLRASSDRPEQQGDFLWIIHKLR